MKCGRLGGPAVTLDTFSKCGEGILRGVYRSVAYVTWVSLSYSRSAHIGDLSRFLSKKDSNRQSRMQRSLKSDGICEGQ
jgi:hypothetical protein